MTTREWHLTLSTVQKAGMLFYCMLVLTFLGATAIRDLHCNGGGVVLLHEEFCPTTSRPSTPLPVATSNTWRKQTLYAAAVAVAGSKKDQPEGRPTGTSTRAPPESTPNNEEYGSRISTDYNIISETCSGTHGLEVEQDNTTVYLGGLPLYHVSVVNTCLDCSLQDIHIACGDWASATEVNPQVFKRVADNDCVVNDGRPIISQGAVYFEYSNSFPYPMTVQSAFPSCS